MAYCTQSDILEQISEDELIQLTDDDGLEMVDADKVTRAIADADEEIDASVSIRYSLPFSATPNLVRKFSVDLAICNLYARRPGTLPEERKERCAEIKTFLDKIAQGKRKLDVPDPTEDSDRGVETTHPKSDRIFSTGRDSDSSTGTLDNY